MFKDYYLILGVSNDATPEEIEKAFNNANEKSVSSGNTRDLQEAYAVLSHQETKLLYDKELNTYNESADFENYEIKDKRLASIINSLQANSDEMQESSSSCSSKLWKGCFWIIIIILLFFLQTCFKIAVKQRNRSITKSYINVEPNNLSIRYV